MDPRKEYTAEPLRGASLAEEPVDQLRRWLDASYEAGVEEANAMVLSTVTPEGAPSSRTVLLKHLDRRGLVFYTNYRSRKAQEIESNPYVASTFLWIPLFRQVIVEGRASRVTREESETYFSLRPRGSQIGAWVSSNQDEPLESREQLQSAFTELLKKTGDAPVPPPDYWGGYRIVPHRFEFWQGQPNRLHDRFAYTREGDSWKIQRLSP